MLSLDKKKFVLEKYLLSRNVRQVQRDFRARFQVNVNFRTVQNIYQKWDTNGKLDNLKPPGRPKSARTTETIERVRDVFEENPRFSTRLGASELDVKRNTLQRILKKDLSLKPYKGRKVHRLVEDDPLKRYEFALFFLEQPHHFYRRVIWTDESHFRLSGTSNVYFSRIWSRKNPDFSIEIPMKGNVSLMVWSGIWYGGIIGPYFFEGRVNAESYLQLLNNTVWPALQGILGLVGGPELVPGSLKPTSLLLEWSPFFRRPLPHLAWTIQRRFSPLGWETLPPQPLNSTEYLVSGLKPYTQYKFRVGWIFAHDFPPHYSNESKSIETLARGLPNGPDGVRTMPISNSSVWVGWGLPSQPNGKLVAYTLKLRKIPHGQPILKEIRVGQFGIPEEGFTFTGLEPNSTYSLAISAINTEGQGDPAIVTFSTPQSDTSNVLSKRIEPRILLQGTRHIFLQNLDLLQEPDLILYASTLNITAMGVHIKYKWVFISTGHGELRRIGLSSRGKNQSLMVLNRESVDLQFVDFISIDWLNDKIYLVGTRPGQPETWTLKRAELNGAKLTTLLPTMANTRPIDFTADPYTGYLFWVLPDGLYKMDLNQDIRRPPTKFLPGPGLGPFTVDFLNYRVLIVSKLKNTILSVSLEGEAIDIRRNSASPQFSGVISLATYSGLFYWTTGGAIVIEEYDEAQDTFYHNSFEVGPHGPCPKIAILHPDLQPSPAPRAPVSNPQVLWGSTRARVNWGPPNLLTGLGVGVGAWQNWRYQVRVSDNSSFINISGDELIIENLKPATHYAVQILAYSPSGRSPLSEEIKGRTLKVTSENVSLLWASSSGLWSTDPLGENVQQILTSRQFENQNQIQGQEENSIWGLAWFENQIFLATSHNGSVYRHEVEESRLEPSPAGLISHTLSYTSSNSLARIKSVGFAQSLAYEHIGGKLYWSDPKRQSIQRCTLGGSDCTDGKAEMLQVITLAKEIALDSHKGLILWTTGHSIEMSHLNGWNHTVLWQGGLFSGIHINGLALDIDSTKAFWITRSGRIQWVNYIFKGPQVPMLITELETETTGPILGPLRFYNELLIWRQNETQVALYDLNFQRISKFSIRSIGNLTSILVRDPSTLTYPHGGGGKDKKYRVRPNPVVGWSIGISGKWNNFKISWQSVNNTNFGKIFYEVVINGSRSEVTHTPYINIENNDLYSPYSDIEITITPSTYWSSGRSTTVTKSTPSWKPSEPRNPRIFVQKSTYPYQQPTLMTLNGGQGQGQGSNISAEIRWDAPIRPNGKILGYWVHCWRDGGKIPSCDVDIENMNCIFPNLSNNSTYIFAIQAYTAAGGGEYSRNISANTGSANTNPVPKLLLTTADKLQILDIDRNILQPLSLGYLLNPLTATYLAPDNTIFWFNEGQDLMMSDLATQNKSRILRLEGSEASHLTVDWIGRRLYWAFELMEKGGDLLNPEQNFGIMTYDLANPGTADTSPLIVHKSRSPLKSLAINPLTSALYWSIERPNGLKQIFKGQTDGGQVRPFLQRGDPTHCNCSLISGTGEAVGFDPNGLKSVLPRGVLFSDTENSIWMADEQGCSCYEVVNISSHGFSRKMKSPYRLVGDENHIFWSSDNLFASEKPGQGLTELMSDGVQEISVLGSSAQPFPEINCLIPRELIPDPDRPLLFNHSSNSLHLQLPPVTIADCPEHPHISMAAPLYAVYYGTVDERGISECTPTSPAHCKSVLSSAPLLHIGGLHPYTTYTVFVTVTNRYAKAQGVQPLVCPPIMLRTAPGKPEPPALLRLETLNPTSIRVVWRQPEKLNGEKVWYEVHWRKNGLHTSAGGGSGNKVNGNGQTWAETDRSSNQKRTEFHLEIGSLAPESNYTIWVVAYSEKGDAFSESEKKIGLTYEPPNNLTLEGATPHSIQISWRPPANETAILRHQLLYRAGWTSEWNLTEICNFTVPGKVYNFSISGLRPRTEYGFRLRAWFLGDPLHPFLWPPDGQFSMKTLADKPGNPGQPIARGVGKDLYDITWDKAEDNGAVVELYSLETRVVYSGLRIDPEEVTNPTPTNRIPTIESRRKRREVEKPEELAQRVQNEKNVRKKNHMSPWKVLFNGTDARWRVKGLDPNLMYTFRIRAKNFYGWGPYSKESDPVILSELTMVADQGVGIGLILGVLAAALLLLAALSLLSLHAFLQKLKEKPSGQPREVTELSTMPSSAYAQQSNILYAASDLILDLESLAGIQKISSDHLQVTHVSLGSGAFGMVYEGLLDGERRVAVKTLRRGHSGQEVLSFLKEAKLMTQFRHPHIVALLGVCVDRDPVCLVLELMAGGDLLSYLRGSRSRGLSLSELLSMCVDISAGCVYLEEKHYVHRDLACRNCLVQEVGPIGSRVVKIADFGLARDIYHNDYYRKDGEAFLPIRWMSPESIVDGLYTTQSDVWSFGVVLWEIMSLGQQPYPARTNLEVLHFVKNGGRLTQPNHCPIRLSNLMRNCWEYEQDRRPSFKDCYREIQFLVQELQAGGNFLQNFTGSDNGHATATTTTAYQYSIEDDELRGDYHPPRRARNGDSDSVFSSFEEDQELDFIDSESPTSYDQQNNSESAVSVSLPKYLQVISNSPPENDENSYEIPKPLKPPRRPRASNSHESSVSEYENKLALLRAQALGHNHIHNNHNHHNSNGLLHLYKNLLTDSQNLNNNHLPPSHSHSQNQQSQNHTDLQLDHLNLDHLDQVELELGLDLMTGQNRTFHNLQYQIPSQPTVTN